MQEKVLMDPTSALHFFINSYVLTEELITNSIEIIMN